MANVIPPPAPLGTDAAGDRFGLGPAAGARPETAAERRFRFELTAHPGAVAQARRVTRTRLSGWAHCEDTCDTAALVVSELVTNAIVHTASTQIVCELHDGDELVRIAVRDEGCAPGEPHPSPQRPEEEHGRGLLLIESLCRSWGAQPSGLGLLVWADLPRMTTAGGFRSGADPGTATTAAAVADTGARSDLGWGAKKPPTEGRGDTGEQAESSCRTQSSRRAEPHRAESSHRAESPCRTESGGWPTPERGRTGAEWV
ncbi:ATP-binding protein [Streptomyces ipomoeae]|uniref:ATP-binding protein n=1 Tax=Streptomyces ipomoeae TaxID=103232 RepID=A0AAE8W0Z2_9ACTN|nr:ATP-binding protein [Streptomyces ipomoeae]MDX2696371.1 ATP-binding protein [Streptomyces ipomoeae]MDX2823989.1 ATP-binding protein [Streptomyces ipomoeae]MDX2843483.1 ATP-binding protein [Streptomyces ipomoeae]MDX2876563.1 ATP-binding protein [Streptomyces ipomoeae]TQE23117.1 ATP-binding protein [Streptomyces ipomoeae]